MQRFFIVMCLVFLICISTCCWYFTPRVIVPEFVSSVAIPNASFDLYNCKSLELVQDSGRLYQLITDKSYSLPSAGFDSTTIQKINKILNYQTYSYILIWNKELVELHYSPYLTKNKDGLYFDKSTPLFPITRKEKTDSLYIYSIPKTNKFRAPGP